MKYCYPKEMQSATDIRKKKKKTQRERRKKRRKNTCKE
jgi:hypothetical protein